MKNAITILVIVAASLLSGCASIVNGTNQVVSVETRHKDGMVTGATCRLENPKGVFFVTTPGTVTINRAYDDLNVKCEKADMEPGMAVVKSTTKGMAFGNILFGGVIGAAVDAGSGAAYDYPTMISVMMGNATPPAATAITPAQVPTGLPAVAPAPPPASAPSPATEPASMPPAAAGPAV